MSKHEELYKQIDDYYNRYAKPLFNGKIELMYLKSSRWREKLKTDKFWKEREIKEYDLTMFDCIILGTDGSYGNYDDNDLMWDVLHDVVDGVYCKKYIKEEGKNELLDLIIKEDLEFAGYVDMSVSKIKKEE